MLVAEPQVQTDQQDAEAAFERARDDVRDLQAALAALPEAYTQAVKRGAAADMRAARVSKIDLEEQLIVARVVVARAEVALIESELAGFAGREQEAARVVQTSYAANKAAQAALEAAIRASNNAQNDATMIRAQRDDVAFRLAEARKRLQTLTAVTLPE